MDHGTQDYRVSREWASRPDDERFLSLQELHDHVSRRADGCAVTVVNNSTGLQAFGTEENEMVLNTRLGPTFFTNWSFGQVSGIAQAPASYLRRLPSELAAACLNDGFRKADRDSMLMVNGGDQLRCATSPSYGRIWDKQVTQAVMRATEGGNWTIPAASYGATNPKRATTLYASDRDVFIFLVDVARPIEIDGEQLFRGFYTWNSEVGSQVFGLATFLYRRVCDNRIIWGISHRDEIRIKHSSGAPERFEREGRYALQAYSSASTKPIVEQIERAKAIKVGKDEDEVKEFLKKRGFTMATADSVIKAAKAEENEYNTPWSLAQGITAHARGIAHTDTRVLLEREAGKLLNATVGAQN